ncbi:response regulator transcription factor [Clostridium sp.]|uniref:response regulator transcription factor n=1 Tax=Clostridium sp. TaxID=1506 RepID=UPI002FC83ED5
MNKLLLVEDDEALALGIEFTLKDEGYDVLRVDTLSQGRDLFQKEKFDLILLDINLPDGNGYDLCKYIRTKSQVPIIFLTALDDEVNVVLGLEIGGDDYITKPFRVRELLSRIKALIRRSVSATISGEKFKSGDISVNTLSTNVKKVEEDIILTAQEYKLLLIFMNNPQVLMKRDDILGKLIEGDEVFFDENTLSVYIKRIREKIEDNPKEPQYIVTQRGLGYKWNKAVIKE